MSDASASCTLSTPAGRWLPWAVYLGMSWTWCIGMFLPVLLARDLGPGGFVVFALPNVVGAAAMGWVIRRRAQGRRLVNCHRPAMQAFTWVTVAFHIFFMQWFVAYRLGVVWGPWLMLAALLVAHRGLRQGGRGGGLIAAAATLGVSLVCAGLMFSTGSECMRLPGGDPGNARSVLAMLSVCLLGFGLCPYLDLTFHEARGRLPTGHAKPAFAAGFGVFFLPMIVLALLYAATLATVLQRRSVALPDWWAGALAIHMAVQSALTILLHTRAAGGNPDRKSARETPPAANRQSRDPHPADPQAESNPGINWPLWLAVALPLVLADVCMERWTLLGHDCGETIYRLFMGFYGLVFPAYVWICMRPLARPRPPDIRQWVRFGLAVTLAGPFYHLGFVAGHMAWLPLGVAVVLAAGWGAGKQGTRATTLRAAELGSARP